MKELIAKTILQKIQAQMNMKNIMKEKNLILVKHLKILMRIMKMQVIVKVRVKVKILIDEGNSLSGKGIQTQRDQSSKELKFLWRMIQISIKHSNKKSKVSHGS